MQFFTALQATLQAKLTSKSHCRLIQRHQVIFYADCGNFPLHSIAVCHFEKPGDKIAQSDWLDKLVICAQNHRCLGTLGE